MQQHNLQIKKKMKDFFYFLFRCKITQQGKMMTRSKPREWKENSGLKRRSQTESEPKMQKQSRTH